MRSLLVAILATLLLASPASAAPTWLPSVDLGAETADTSSSGKIALGADGTAVAAWSQFTGSTYVLQMARRAPGAGFGPAITVPGTASISLSVGGVAVDGAGNATIAYEQGGAIIARPWPAAAVAPGAPQPFETGASPTIAVGRNGSAVVAWINAANPIAPVVKAAARDEAGANFGAASTISFPGNGSGSVTGLDVAVGDRGNATVVWSRVTTVPNTVVEAIERAPGGSFPGNGGSISDSVGAVVNISPAVAVDPSGRSTVLWENQSSSRIDYAEHAPAQPDWSTPQPASLTNPAATPAIGVAPSGVFVGAWQSGGAIETGARPAGGGGFADYRTLTGAAMDASLPIVEVGGNGDALISWSTLSLHELYTVRRAANGAFGPIQTAYSNGGRAGENYFNPSLGIDDQGNGVAAWTRTQTRNSTNFYRFQAATFDAAAPTLSSSVPPGAQVGAPIGMAAAASDRVSPVSIAWGFGDGGTASGGAVSHAFGTAGAFTVTVTATDVAGNATTATHPVLIAPGPPPKKKRIRAKVRATWGVTSRRTFLLKLKVLNVPKRGKAELRCKGKKCPFKRVSSKKRRKGDITLFKEIKATQVAGKKKRTFRPGQRLELRITKKAFIGQVVRYKLRRNKIPSGKELCLPVGKKKPRKRCP